MSGSTSVQALPMFSVSIKYLIFLGMAIFSFLFLPHGGRRPVSFSLSVQTVHIKTAPATLRRAEKDRNI